FGSCAFRVFSSWPPGRATFGSCAFRVFSSWPPGRATLTAAPLTSPLLRLPLHGRCIRVLLFEPIGRAPGAIHRVLPVRHDAFESHLAGVGEDGRAVALDMLVEPDAGASLGQDRCERGLTDLKRISRSSNRICRFLDRGELFACKFNFEHSLESQAVILLARADGAGEFCDATTRATGDQ